MPEDRAACNAAIGSHHGRHENSSVRGTGTNFPKAGAAMVSEANIVTETAARICADLADPQIINGASGGQWKAPLWRALEDAGLTRAWVSGQLGGAGGTISDGFSVIGVAGRYALPVPPSETLLASASSKPPNTNLRNRLATKDRDFKGDGRAPNFVER